MSSFYRFILPQMPHQTAVIDRISQGIQWDMWRHSRATFYFPADNTTEFGQILVWSIEQTSSTSVVLKTAAS